MSQVYQSIRENKFPNFWVDLPKISVMGGPKIMAGPKIMGGPKIYGGT